MESKEFAVEYVKLIQMSGETNKSQQAGASPNYCTVEKFFKWW